MKKWIKKNYVHLSKITVVLAKMNVHFSNQFFRSGFHLFDWLLLIVHWYVFFYLVQLKVYLLRLFHVLREVRKVRQRGQ